MLLLASIEPLSRLAGSVIMSAVYSYKAARRDDSMIERATKAAAIITTELRPEVAAVFSTFPFR